jgi:hypothetical protein
MAEILAAFNKNAREIVTFRAAEAPCQFGRAINLTVRGGGA